MITRQIAAVLLAAGLLTTGLTGCMAGPPMPIPTGTGASASASASPSASPTPTPTEEVGADEPAQAPTAPVTCESLVSTSLTTFTTGGLSIVDEATTSARLHNEGDPFALFFDAGGAVCIVSTGYEAYGIYAWGPINDAAWGSIRAALFTEGWSEQITDAGVQLTAPEPGPLSICYYRPNQFGGCASTLALLDEVFANAPG
ncbi:MAG: hypothetical protein ABI566_05520 [Pseudolysinimonas sp.]